MTIFKKVPAEGIASVDTSTSKLRISNSNQPSSFDQHIERNPNINDRNITGFCVVFAFFVAGLLTNIVIAQKLIILGPLVLPASVFIWALTFPCSDIAAEVYGRQYAHKLVLGGFIGYASAMLVFLEAVAMPHAPFWPHQEAFETVLGSSLRVMLAALTVYLIAQFFDVHIYGYIRKKTKGKHLWLRNNISTLGSQTITNTVFLTLAFLGTIPMEKWWTLFFSNLMARYALAFIDTSIVYAGVHGLYKLYPELKPKEKNNG